MERKFHAAIFLMALALVTNISAAVQMTELSDWKRIELPSMLAQEYARGKAEGIAEAQKAAHPEAAMTREQVLEEAAVTEDELLSAYEKWRGPTELAPPSFASFAAGFSFGVRRALASTRQEPAPAADAEEIAKKLEALGSTLSSRAKQYAGCSWFPDPSKPIADSAPGMWEYRQAALCADAAAALRRYAGDGGVTDEMVEAATDRLARFYSPGLRSLAKDAARSILQAAARAKSGEKGGAR